MSPEQKARLAPWIWAFVGVTALVALVSPVVIMAAYSCCSGQASPTAQLLLKPALPLIQLLDPDSLLSFALVVGLSYGFPVLALGIVITALRRAWRG